MKKTLLLFASIILTLTSQAQASYTAGMVDDGQAHYNNNYPTFTPPAKGQSYTDPVFGSTVTRLTNGSADYNDAIHHEYASMSPFNADDSYIAVVGDNTGWKIIDKTGAVIDNNPPGRGPRWSPTNPDIYYYYNYNSNKLYKYTVSTKQSTLLKTFSQYNFITWGHSEDDISPDGDHLVIVGDDQYIGVYTISNDTYGSTLNTQITTGFDWADVTASNMVVIRWDGVGNGNYKGYCLYDQNMNFVRQLAPWGAHADRGVKPNGDEIVFAGAYSDVNPPTGCETNGAEVIDNATATKTCALPGSWNFEMHLSTNASNGWGLVSYFDGRTSGGTASGTLPGNWKNIWEPYANEVVLVKLDGNEIRRICHTYARTIGSYWQYPRVAMSRSGKYAIFDSNFGNDYGISDYTDVFMVDLGLSVPTNVAPVISKPKINIINNITSDAFYVEVINQQKANVTFQVFDCVGREIDNTNIDQTSSFHQRVDVSGWNKGVYFVNVIINGEKTTHKVIVN